MAERNRIEPFSEKGFYLSEFRGRSLAIAARAAELARPDSLVELLGELEANATRVVLVSSAGAPAERLAGRPVLAWPSQGLEGRVWRALCAAPRAAVVVPDGPGFAAGCREVALRLGLDKVMWVDAAGGLRRPGGERRSFVDLEELGRMLEGGCPGAGDSRRELLEEVRRLLEGGVGSVNLSSLEGLAEELFTWAGSGTLFTRERYVEVRRLGLDDYAAADHLIARGVEEGYLAARSPEQVERVLARAFGAFVEGRYLAGIGALLPHPEAGAAEIASLYTLTRFLGEGVGGFLVAHAVERARADGARWVFACTTSDRVARFFERHDFARVGSDALPMAKWREYPEERRRRLLCLRRDL